ncbi:Boca protein [Operophtera brumata]|uniref:Boca protein n=1 Tax=Operophtera brumata TaxID=104452 RepID=A0A0L7KPL6_OPEBR|nr:Boca protein [Operophtera brumata]
MAKLLYAIVLLCCTITIAKKRDGEDKPAWAKKDIRDYSDADMERKPPSIDMSKMDMSNPEAVLQATKKGQTLMIYLIDDDRAIFMFKDGSQAWEAKAYLLEQDELKEVQLESQTYPGKNPDVKNKAIRDEL